MRDAKRHLTVRRPGAPLADFVELLWHATGTPGERLEEVLPFGKAQLFINLKEDGVRWVRTGEDRLRMKGIVLQGPMLRPMLIDPRDQARLVGATFHGWGLAPLVSPPVSSLRDQLVSLDDVGPGVDLAVLPDRLREAPSPSMCLAVFEAALSRCFSAQGVNGAVRNAACRLDGAGDLSIARLRDELGLTSRSFSREFEAAVGMRPKMWQRVRRFRRSLGRLEAGEAATRVSRDLGWSDQPHFNHEFLHFSGRSPHRYLRSERSYQGHVVVGSER
ncbi:MAG: helix-turn-helix domain-containing protein [Myxococcota bacterium]